MKYLMMEVGIRMSPFHLVLQTKQYTHMLIDNENDKANGDK